MYLAMAVACTYSIGERDGKDNMVTKQKGGEADMGEKEKTPELEIVIQLRGEGVITQIIVYDFSYVRISAKNLF